MLSHLGRGLDARGARDGGRCGKLPRAEMYRLEWTCFGQRRWLTAPPAIPLAACVQSALHCHVLLVCLDYVCSFAYESILKNLSISATYLQVSNSKLRNGRQRGMCSLNIKIYVKCFNTLSTPNLSAYRKSSDRLTYSFVKLNIFFFQLGSKISFIFFFEVPIVVRYLRLRWPIVKMVRNI